MKILKLFLQIFVLSILIEIVLASNYPAGDASHDTLYTYTITDKGTGAGPGLVTVADDLYITGKVGIGTPTSTAPLHVYSPIGSTNINLEGQTVSQQALNWITLGDGSTNLGSPSTLGWHLVARSNSYTSASQRNDLLLFYWDGSSWNNYMYWDNETGNVGIGTNFITPGQKLDVSSPFSQLRLTDSDDGDFVSLSYSSDMLAFRNNVDDGSTPILAIHDNGNVGIGTTTPSHKLHVVGDLNVTGTIYGGGGGGGGGNGWIDTGTNIILETTTDKVGIGTTPTDPNTKLAIGGNGGSLRLYSELVGGHTWIGMYTDGSPGSTRAGWIGYQIDGDLDFTITNQKPLGDIILNPAAGGKVGIGTTTPGTLLHLKTTNAEMITLDRTDNAAIEDTFLIGVGQSGGDDILTIRASSSGSNLLALEKTGNVGIGTTSPGQKLSVEGSGIANEVIARFNNQGDFSSRIWLRNAPRSAYFTVSGSTADPSAIDTLPYGLSIGISGTSSPIQFWTGATPSVKMTILENGNTGIGTTSPGARLDIENSVNTDPQLIVSSLSGNGLSASELIGGISFFSNDPDEQGISAQIKVNAPSFSAHGVGDIPGEISFLTVPDGSTTLATRMTISENGNIGIGTTNPIVALHVGNTIDSFTSVTIQTSTTGESAVTFADSDTNRGRISYFHNGDDMTFRVADAERMRIDSSGNVGIGTTNPQLPLHIDPPTGNAWIRFTDISNNNWNVGADNGPSGFHIYRASVGQSDFFIGNSNGNVGIGTTNPSHKLHVVGDLNVTGNIFTGTGGGGGGNGWTDTGTEVILETATDNVGIGTISPAVPLDVSGVTHTNRLGLASLGSASSPALFWTGATTTGIFRHSGVNDIAFSTAGSERMVIDASGNVGIGTTPTDPMNKLAIGGNEGSLRLFSNQAGGHTWIGMYTEGGPVSARAGWIGYGTDGDLDFTITNEKALGDIILNPAAGGNVGIGATGPGEKLTVSGRISLTTDPDSDDDVGDRGYNDVRFINVGESGDSIADNTIDSTEIQDNTIQEIDLELTNSPTNNYILSYDSGTAGFTWVPDAIGSNLWSVSGSNVYRSSGNVGIGTTSPGQKLDVNSNVNDYLVKIENDGSTAAAGGLHIDTRWNVPGNYPLRITSNSENVEILVVEGTGNVGIGTTNPGARLDVQSASASLIRFGVNMLSADQGGSIELGARNNVANPVSGGRPFIDFHYGNGLGQDRNVRIMNNADGSLILEASTLIHTGDVGIGTTTPSDRLHVIGPGTSSPIVRLATTGTGDRDFRFRISGPASDYDTLYIQGETAQGSNSFNDLMSIRSNGNIGIGTFNPVFKLDVAGSAHASSFPTSSDSRFKENVVPVTNALEKLSKVRGVYFDWNKKYEELGRATKGRQIGVIAQEFEKEFPELVTTWGEEDYRAVDYGRLTGVLIEAVKELNEENKDLKRRIQVLERS